ncbi:hypothetical protein A9G11_07150 [Gilliamella sp. wkB108]|uniref:enhanced serine sensitivity protein SseB n=1 Tax=Gilliamella sp. wkB108 TaxID=3120256 RepID=UPI00080DD7CE|nr:enhanced serine sensitivity protein SseB [Gilliamella apicola]OCG22456.1 hypothetical protein A9G11_07150 [Gilliamella apicola]
MSFNINEPVTNPELIEALQAFNAAPSIEKQKLLFNKIKDAKLLAPIMIVIPDNVEKNEDNTMTLTQETQLSFVMINNNKNEQFFPAFTDWDELRKWQNIEDQQTLVVNIVDYQSLLKDSKECHGVVINPFGNIIQIDRTILEAIVSGNIPPSAIKESEISITEDTEVLIGSPTEYPQQLVNAICQHLQTKSEVNSAYLRLMIQNQQQSFLIVLDINQGINPKLIFNELGEVIKPYLVQDKFVDFITADTSFGQQAIKDEKPFYKKKKGILNRLFGK